MTVGARSDSKESYDALFESQAVSRRIFPPFRHGCISSCASIRQHRQGYQVADLLRAVRRIVRSFGAGFESGKGADGADLGIEATFADQRFRGARDLLR